MSYAMRGSNMPRYAIARSILAALCSSQNVIYRGAYSTMPAILRTLISLVFIAVSYIVVIDKLLPEVEG
jgi:hypothetical protein